MISKQLTYFALFLYALAFVTNGFAALTCSNPREECAEGKNETRYIENVPVNPGCWKKRFISECRETADNNCQTLRDQKCSQISAKCIKSVSGTCVVQDETYSCPFEQCDEVGDILCGKNLFCVDGKCASTNPVKASEKDRGKALAQLSALNEIANQIKDQGSENPAIFAGRVMECSRNILPGITKDCCADNEGLFSCTEEEKNLFQMRRVGRAIAVGEYCHNKELGFCSSYHTAYCVFESRIGRIIQNDGRQKQLGIGFGYVNDDDKAGNVNCRGVTKEELAQMKFELMNFSELYEELEKEAKKRMLKPEILNQRVSGYSPDDLKTRSTKNLGVSQPPESNISQKAAERIKDFYGDRVKK